MFDALLRFDSRLNGAPIQEGLNSMFESYCKQNKEGKNISDFSVNTLRMYSKKELFIDALDELYEVLSRIDDGVTLSAVWDDGDEFGATILIKGYFAEASAKLEDVAVSFCTQNNIALDEGEIAFDKASKQGLWDYIGDIRDRWENDLERKIYIEVLGVAPPEDLQPSVAEQVMERIASDTNAIMEESDQVLEAFDSGGVEAVAELGEGTNGGSESGASDENDPEQGFVFDADGFARWLLGLVAYRHNLISSTEGLRIVHARAYITGEQLSTEKGLMKIAHPELKGEREAALDDTAAWAQYILDEVISDDLPALPFHLIVAGDESIRNALHIDPSHAGHWMFTGHIDEHGVHLVRVGETPGGDETVTVYPLQSELREIAAHTAIPEGVLTGEMNASSWYAGDASEDHDAHQDSEDGTSDLEDFMESGEEDDDEDTDWGGQEYTATGLHMGKDGAWVMADLALDSEGDIMDVIFSRLELGELPDLGDADEHFVITDAPFRFAEELHEDGEREPSKDTDAAAESGEVSDAVIGANRWSKRKVVPFFERHRFEEVYTSNDPDLSEYGISKKSIDAIPFIESIREKYGTSSSNIQLACPEMAMLAVGEKRIKFQHARTSIAGTEERAQVLSAKLEDRNIQAFEGDWVFADIFELVSDAKKEEGIPLYDLLDSFALVLVARDWIVEEEKLVVSGKAGKVVPWNGSDFEFFAMPNTKKKVPPK